MESHYQLQPRRTGENQQSAAQLASAGNAAVPLVDNRNNAPVVQLVKNAQKATKIKPGNFKKAQKLHKSISKIRLAGKVNPKASRRASKMFTSKKAVVVKDFDRAFHGHKGQDEMLSTATTLAHASTLQQQGKFNDAEMLVELSDKARFPTAFMGHHVQGSQFQHPTSRNTTNYGSSGTGHGSFDRDRAEYTKAAKDPEDAIMRSIEYSMNYGAQPPFASNSLVKKYKDMKAAREAHNLREDFKDLYRGKRGKAGKANRPWKPGGVKRGVSPPRERFK